MSEQRIERPDWDSYLMALACLTAMRSHDPSSKCGAVVADSRHRVLGVGYNGFPFGGKQDIYPLTRPEKYRYIKHAEANALRFAQRIYGLQLGGPILYATSFPCHQCMGDAIQAEVSRIVYGNIGTAMVDDQSKMEVQSMAENHGIELVSFQCCGSLGSPHKVLADTIKYLSTKGWKDEYLLTDGTVS